MLVRGYRRAIHPVSSQTLRHSGWLDCTVPQRSLQQPTAHHHSPLPRSLTRRRMGVVSSQILPSCAARGAVPEMRQARCSTCGKFRKDAASSSYRRRSLVRAQAGPADPSFWQPFRATSAAADSPLTIIFGGKQPNPAEKRKGAPFAEAFTLRLQRPCKPRPACNHPASNLMSSGGGTSVMAMTSRMNRRKALMFVKIQSSSLRVLTRARRLRDISFPLLRVARNAFSKAVFVRGICCPAMMYLTRSSRIISLSFLSRMRCSAFRSAIATRSCLSTFPVDRSLCAGCRGMGVQALCAPGRPRPPLHLR